MKKEITVPDIGDFQDIDVIEVLISEGGNLKKEDPLITIESDKASMEIPSPYSGSVSQVFLKLGDKVSKGTPIAVLDITDESISVQKSQNKTNAPSKGSLDINVDIEPKKTSWSEKIKNIDPTLQIDRDPLETEEWINSLQAVVERDGYERAHFLLENLIKFGYEAGAKVRYTQTTPYINTIPQELEKNMPGDATIEKRIRSIIRWNTTAMVTKANSANSELGGHIATFLSAATLYDVGFNHFWRSNKHDGGGDLIYIQGHSSPGIYARAFLEGRLTEKQLLNFRREVDGKGLSSYPHPWLMKDFWQFPSVSMGLGSIMGIYQARFMQYLHNRDLIDSSARKVWVFLGDGEMDEPEAVGSIGLAAREKLDNLIFVINCNLQRLDGPVRGNSKIIQELEGRFRGAGWNVIKVIWGSNWDPLLAKDKTGLLRKRMEECVDGEYQNIKARDGSYVRKEFFGKYPELLELVSNMSDSEIWNLLRGGHDAHKVYNAYLAATKNKGSPTVILAKTIKGFGIHSMQGSMTAHQQKKIDLENLKKFRDAYDIPISDEELPEVPFYKPEDTSQEIQYMKLQRKKLGGFIPSRISSFSNKIFVPPLSEFKELIKGTQDREMSTTMGLLRVMTVLIRNKKISKYLVPIIPDEARTFGMEGMFRQLGIYSQEGQKYTPVDYDQVSYYREDIKGQVLQEGITEAGAMSSWIAAGTSYNNHGLQTIPVYIFYSMFGFQRVGDLAWAAGDAQARGFLIGATSGKTTLSGEGLQHQDGFSHLIASNIPNCVSYDPTFNYELAVIFRSGLERMYDNQENIFYYITTLNENYKHPEMPEGVEDGIVKGMYRFRKTKKDGIKLQLMGSGAILREIISAAEILEEEYGIAVDIWSVTSFNELRREALSVERWNNLNPEKNRRKSYFTSQIENSEGPIIAATDYVKLYPDQVRSFIPHGRAFATLGTDGYGRSDTRKKLRSFFEVDSNFIVFSSIKTLWDQQLISVEKVQQAMKNCKIDSEKLDPAKI